MGTLWRTTFLLLVQGLQSMWTGARAKNRSCVSYGSSTLTEGMEHLRGLILEDGRNGTIQCPHNQCCFGVWNVIQGQLQAQLKGCWISEKKATCDSPTCEPRYSEDELTLSCRCRADMCNDNIRHDGKRSADSMQSSTGIIWIISVCSALFFLGFFAFLVLRLWKGPALPMRPQETGELTNITTGSERYSERKLPKQELLDLQFHKVLHEGQCSKVWQGTFGQHPVAIKTFPPPCYREFASEWAVHSLPLMSHDNVVRLVAAGCGGPDKEQGGLLVLTLYPLGSLRHFLTQHVCSWDVALRLGSSLAKGLAFLHGQQWKEGLYKPGVAHRDLSSQNVLVQEDRTCVISDFGLAITLPVRHEQWRGPPVEGIIRKAGTPRYTAPEILDESLNLQDSGSALRQADVYSMALVLWETLMRCSILFPESSTPEFQLAYEAELGSNPTYNELRRLAVEERGRPAIPPSWRRMGQVSVCLQELLEDCWDPEPEARLQAQCAQDRLQMLGAADVTKECC
ncbi:anti-Muellerian hormone type-2 receptor isoform X2 [Heteronotia binoei]|uniref:anti-Muellerian hormone type-2 receptor isoform X2 n=1 Tax=Heteronotia binoei TaxID=13085 RepID=UPI00292FBD6D|nr:anti-Muellerian hormone type-2 receptor isoform X2 [Heteronotia binoei]